MTHLKRLGGKLENDEKRKKMRGREGGSGKWPKWGSSTSYPSSFL